MFNNKNKKIAIFSIGISASGKTFWAKDYIKTVNPRFFIVSRDDIRASLCLNKVLDWSKWDWKKEKEVTVIQNSLIENLHMNETCDGIIIADTNLSIHAIKLAKNCKEIGYEVQYKEFDISIKEAIDRDAKRGILCVGESVIRQQHQKWTEYKTQDFFAKSGFEAYK